MLESCLEDSENPLPKLLPRSGYAGTVGKKSVWVQVGEYTALAFVLPTTTFVGYIAGYLLDRWLGTSFLYLVFLLIGIAAGFLQVFRQVKKDSGGG